MFGQEPYAPYDRPVISKNLNAKIDKLLLRTPQWLHEEASVEFHPDTRINDVDVKTKTVVTDKGSSFQCDKVC